MGDCARTSETADVLEVLFVKGEVRYAELLKLYKKGGNEGYEVWHLFCVLGEGMVCGL